MVHSVFLLDNTGVDHLKSSVYVCVLSCVRLFATPRAVTRQALLSMGFSRQEYWNGLPFPSAGDLPNTGIKPTSFESSALAGRFFTTRATWEAQGILFFLSIQHSAWCETL